MSVVTSVVIVAPNLLLFDKYLDLLNEYIIKEENSHCHHFLDVTEIVKIAGTKSLQRCVLLGAFNYLDKKSFIEFFKSLRWENSLLILCPDDSDEQYEIVLGVRG